MNESVILEILKAYGGAIVEKVVITGMGAICSIGKSVPEIWQNLINGVSGAGEITLFDNSDLIVKIACEVKDFDPSDYISAKDARRRDRHQIFAAIAVREALLQAGISSSEVDPERVGMVISSGIGGITALEKNILEMERRGARRVNPFLIPMLMPNGAAGQTGIDHQFKGPAISVASACASAQDGIGTAKMMIQTGMADVVIAGGAEASITKIGVSAFDRIGATSRAEPGSVAPRPFDLNRDGLVVGEGAGILILETETHAKSRGAKILGELAGYGATVDAFHITAPTEDGSGSSRAVNLALKDAGLAIDDIGYINAHGTGTQLNDSSETNAIKRSFGKHAYDLHMSSTKSMTGHMMGATGALEAIICTKAIQAGILPPTINYETPDPECDLNYVPNKAMKKDINAAITDAFGFGGHNSVLVIKKYS